MLSKHHTLPTTGVPNRPHEVTTKNTDGRRIVMKQRKAIKASALLCSACVLSIVMTSEVFSSSGSFLEGIQAYDKEKQFRKVPDFEKNQVAKDLLKQKNLINSLRKGIQLTPLRERLDREKENPREPRLQKDAQPEKVFNEIRRLGKTQDKTFLVPTREEIVKVNWNDYAFLKQKLQEANPQMKGLEEKFHQAKKRETQNQKELDQVLCDKKALDVLLLKLESLQRLESKNVLYPADKKEKEKILRALEIDSEAITPKKLEEMITATQKHLEDVQKKIPDLTKKQRSFEKDLYALKRQGDTFERQANNFCLGLEDIWGLKENDLISKKSDQAYARLNRASSELPGASFLLEQKTLGEFLTFFKKLEKNVEAFLNLPSVKKLREEDQTHVLALDEKTWRLYLNRQEGTQGGHMTLEEMRTLELKLSALSDQLHQVKESDFFQKGQGIYDYSLSFEAETIQLNCPKPICLDRLKTLHAFLRFHGSKKISERASPDDFILQAPVIMDYEQPTTPEDSPTNPLWGSALILETSTIGLPKSDETKEDAGNLSFSESSWDDSETTASSEESSDDDSEGYISYAWSLIKKITS